MIRSLFRHGPLLLALLAAGPLTLPAQAPRSGGGPGGPAVQVSLNGAFTSHVDMTARGAPAGGFGVSQAGLRLSVPLAPLGDRWFPSLGLDYKAVSLDRDAGTPLPDHLHSLGASLSVFGKLPEDWSVLGVVSPRLANAGSGFSSSGLGFGVIALANRRFTSEFTGGLGFAYDSLARGTGRIIPIATFDWTPAPAWRVFLGFPRTGASWQASPAVLAEFVAEADFGSYHVSEDPLPRSLTRPPLDRTRLEYQAVRVGPAVTWQASAGLHVRLAAGFVPVLNTEYHQRHYKLKADDTAGFASLELGTRF